jgi:putative tricarboxylic transport membrane protein
VTTLLLPWMEGEAGLAALAARVLGGAIASVAPVELAWEEGEGWPVDFSGWRGVIGPAGMSAAQIAYWEGIFARLVRHPEWQGILQKRLWVHAYMNSSETRQYLDAQSRSLGKVLAGLGLTK